MASATQIRTRVRAYFKADHPNSTDDSKFKEDFGLGPREVLDKGTELAIELGCNPTRSQILKCKTIKALIQLLIDTRINASGVLVLLPQHFAQREDIDGILPVA